MTTTGCAYCNYEAIGMDEDDEPTCGADSCAPRVADLPRVLQVSGEEEEDEDER